jgi:exodeoxyribonuclease VII large subunit
MAVEPEHHPISVSEASDLAKSTLRRTGTLCVIGEVSGFRGQARGGHCYFEIKDEEATLAAIIWRSTYERLGFALEDGQELIMYGTFDVYKGSGRMSFVISHAELAGEGQLRQQVALLAKRLQAEGLMDPARKRPIPKFCERIVVCTSYSGKVLHDVEQTLARRNPLVAIDTVECAVQGPTAPATIVRALSIAAKAKPDAILLVRGGGSLEELMCFNDEQVARAIAACPVPIVTGIGHEPDTTIADMVCDLRASTPTAAAEQVAPAIGELIDVNATRGRRLKRALAACVSELAQRVELLGSRPCLASPFALIEERSHELDLTEERLFSAPGHLIDRHARELDHMSVRLDSAARRICTVPSARIERLGASLTALSPLSVLGRGYAIVRSDDGHVVTSIQHAAAGDALTIQLVDGGIRTQVIETQEGRIDS